MITVNGTIYLLFTLAISLHNLEEAVWLPGWSKSAGRFHKEVSPDEFRFAVILVTILAYLATSLFLFFPEGVVFKYLYFGFLGAMLINVAAPHLVATVVLRRYMPGLITGVFLLWPVNGLIIWFAWKEELISWAGLGMATLVVGGCLLVLIPFFFRFGELVTGTSKGIRS